MYWMQQSTAQGGNGSVTLKTVGNFNTRYGVFFRMLVFFNRCAEAD